MIKLNSERCRPPILFIISGPSGSGKGTLMRRIQRRFPTIERVINYTTRDPRLGEIDGTHYHFIDERTFLQLQRDGHIFEAERVYQDYYYGSPAHLLEAGVDRLIEVDYKGHRTLKQEYPSAVSFFLMPPSLNELERRILERSPEANMAARMVNAREQIRFAQEYDYILINDDLKRCASEAFVIILAERIRVMGQLWTDHFIRNHHIADPDFDGGSDPC